MTALATIGVLLLGLLLITWPVRAHVLVAENKIAAGLYVFKLPVKRWDNLLAVPPIKKASPPTGSSPAKKRFLRCVHPLLQGVALAGIQLQLNCLTWDPAAIWWTDGAIKPWPGLSKLQVVPRVMRDREIGGAEIQVTFSLRRILLAWIFGKRRRNEFLQINQDKQEEQAMANIDQILSDMERMISTKTVIGQPLTVDGITLIPITSVSFGLGTGEKGEASLQTGGAATGFRVNPVAVIVIKDNGVNVLPVNGSANPERLLAMLPEVWEKIKGKAASEKKEEGLS